MPIILPFISTISVSLPLTLTCQPVSSPENKGLTGAAKITVRIPEDAMPDITIRNGDFIVRGAVDAIEKQADLKGLEYFTVLSVGDNRRSRRKDLRHWAVSGA